MPQSSLNRWLKLFAFAVATIAVNLAVVADSATASEVTRADRSNMNDISYKDYAGFWEKWPLVTVRFREDTKEMRFTYANDLAYKALLSGAREFPDGSVFGKFGALTEADPSFTSSVVPTGKQRFQLMVKNKRVFRLSCG